MPRLSFSVVDVRDVAELHLRAMDAPAASEQRFIAAAGDPIWLSDVARLLRVRHLSADKARRVLGWQPRPIGDTIMATAESLLRLGVAPDAPPRGCVP
jgi:dihydroflavonol-4-reductase